mmetsp:Transcript_72406/g.207716  ORF Transcript_72406/g.207716 Transcript_72406/m.207716 type:complete len:268 (+) Transcript_72406:302-1105(+)
MLCLPVEVRTVRPTPARDEDRKRHGNLPGHGDRQGELLARGLPIRHQLLRATQRRSEQRRLLGGRLTRASVREDEEVSALQGQLQGCGLRWCPHGLDVIHLGKLAVELVDSRLEFGLKRAALVEAHAVPIDIRIPRADPQLGEAALATPARGAAHPSLLGVTGILRCRWQSNRHSQPPTGHRQKIAQQLQLLADVQRSATDSRKGLQALGQRAVLVAVAHVQVRPSPQDIFKPVLRIDGDLPIREGAAGHGDLEHQQAKTQPLFHKR